MVDVHKIDSFFNNKEAFRSSENRPSKRSRVLRLLKLLLPSIAAILMALILIFPNMKKNTLTPKYDVTIPKKGELEKLHVEKTSFFTTDADGKVSSFTADLMDETETGSQIIKITNPKGKIPLDTEEKFIDVASEVGFYNQADNVLLLKDDVVAVYDKTTTVETDEAEYDFKKAFGSGNKPVKAEGDWGKLFAEGFSFDKNSDILILNGQSKIIHENNVLYANKKITYYKNDNKVEAVDGVRVDQENSTLYANRVIILFDKDMKIKKIEAFDNVRIETKDGNAKGNYGLYLPDKDEVWLEGNVMIEKDGHLIFGDKAVTNTKTSVSRLMSNSKDRVSGVIRGSVIKGKKYEKK